MGTRNLHKPFRLQRERDGGVQVSRKGSSRRLLALERRVAALERVAIEHVLAVQAMQSRKLDRRRNRDDATTTPASDQKRFAENMMRIHVGASRLVQPTKYELWSKIASDAFNQQQLAALNLSAEPAPAMRAGYRPQPPAEVRRSLLVSTGRRERLWVVAEQAEIDGRRMPWADTPVSRREWLALAIAIVRQAIAARQEPAKPHDPIRGRPR